MFIGYTLLDKYFPPPEVRITSNTDEPPPSTSPLTPSPSISPFPSTSPPSISPPSISSLIPSPSISSPIASLSVLPASSALPLSQMPTASSGKSAIIAVDYEYHPC